MSANIAKRRLVSLLPGFNQTSDLASFFGATVDEVFQPGTSDAISGYIGPQVGSDFYVAEPTASRTFYQLEPGMVSTDATVTTTINYSLTYPDLVAYLAVNGGNTSNHQRLFETDYYVWSPPINIDMLVNYAEYYWFGDVYPSNVYAFNPNDATTGISLSNNNLTAQWVSGWPSGRGTAYGFDDSISTTPSDSAGFDAIVSDSAGFDAVPSGSSLDSNISAAVRTTALPNGKFYIEFSIDTNRYSALIRCGLANTGDSIEQSPGMLSGGNNAIVYGSDGSIHNDSGAPLTQTLKTYAPGDIVGIAWDTLTKRVWFRKNDTAWNASADDPTAGVGGFDISDLLSGGAVTVLWETTGQSCETELNFGGSDFAFTVPIGFAGPATLLASADLPTLALRAPMQTSVGNGVQTVFPLPPSALDIGVRNRETPMAYVNSVPVASVISGDTLVLAVAPANGASVLTCRTPDLAAAITGLLAVNVSDLNTNAVTWLTSSMRVRFIDAGRRATAWDDQSWDSTNWDAADDTTCFVDGVGLSIRLSTDSSMLRGLKAQYTTIDRSSLDRTANGWALRNSWVHQNSFAWSGAQFPARQATRPIIEFVRDLVRYAPQNWSESVAPLFMLYDLDGIALNDATKYADSTFGGNRLFGYHLAVPPSDPPTDSVLALDPTYDANGYLVFSNDSANQTYSYNDTTSGTPVVTPITGLLQYGLMTPTTTGSVLEQPLCVPFWRPAAQPTTQTTGTTVFNGITSSFYRIPSNLQANPDYDDVDTISRSTWTAHFTGILSQQIGFSGVSTGANNYRDTARDPTLGTAIMQHVAPLLKTMLLASSVAFDVLKSIAYVAREYVRFKNKFVKKIVDLYNRGAVADLVLPLAVTIDGGAVLTFDYANSLTVNTLVSGANIYDGTFITAVTATTATLSQNVAGPITQGTPITFTGPWVQTALAALKIGHNTTFPFALSQIGGGQFFIPATPAALGLLPTALPALLSDPTTGQVLSVLGHDGSLTPAFGDWRDDVLLALEMQIYQNLPLQFQTTARPMFDLQRWLGGYFFSPVNGYSFAEVGAVLAPLFELWAQTNSLDYRSNTGYDPTDPFTWNFNGLLDRKNNVLPGNWRAIYRFYYDTEAPHLRPWEMLGFAARPVHWLENYGSAPYLRDNTVLWNDLETGFDRETSTVNSRYARPGLADLIPVNAAGTLLDPVALGIVTTPVTAAMGARSWSAGDGSPVESQWINGSEYRFALAKLSFLLKPARFVEQGWDSLGIGLYHGQWIELDSRVRPRNALQYVHGEVDPDLTTNPAQTATAITGISQWIADYMLSGGASSGVLGAAIRGLHVALIHPMAGFVTAETVQLVADSFGLLPSTDVQSVLYTSPGVSSEVYSGVIVTWTGRSWRVIGYDGREPWFTVIPPNTAGVRGLISLASASEPAIVPWRPGTYYPVQILVSYENSVYQCVQANTSTALFETNYWTARADLSTNMIQAPRVVTYAGGLATTVRVPYGTEYNNYQDIANFLLGWERWLLSRGWSFPGVDTATGRLLDWSLSVEEFLSWAQVQWAPGNFIALSPGQQQLSFEAVSGTILNVEDNSTGFYGLIDRSGRPIRRTNALVSRLDGVLTLAASNADIYLARLAICTVEHALIPSNVTIFGNNVYLPLFNLRQDRLSLTCQRAADWAGRLDAPGFIITDNTLASDFEKQANDVRLMFDIEAADAPTLRNYARHDVGMQIRDYFNNLLLSPNTQFEFYQGMIQEKGTPGCFEKLTRSTLASASSTLVFEEEWAVRLGTFGAPRDPFVTFQLAQADMRGDPQFVSFDSYASVVASINSINLVQGDARWIDPPIMQSGQFAAFFPTRSDYAPALLPTAGPVRFSEVGNAVLRFADVPGLYDVNTNNLPTASLLWIYDASDTPAGKCWYVEPSGNDANEGSANSPFQTLQRAHDACNPGDTVVVAQGTYTASSSVNVLEITASGTAAAPIAFIAAAGSAPIIQGNRSSAAVHFNSVAHVSLRGFEIVGWNGQLNINDARIAAASPTALTSPIYNGAGVMLDQPGTHHIAITDCAVHDFPYYGIVARFADYLTLEHNTVHDNGLYSPLSGGGIGVLNSRDSDQATTTKTFINRNICYNNLNRINDAAQGIVIGGFGVNIAGSGNPLLDPAAYGGRISVVNNLCYNNGGHAISVADSSHVDVLFNSTYQNQTYLKNNIGEIFTTMTYDCTVCNNIMVTGSLNVLASAIRDDTTIYLNNIGYGGNGVTPLPGVGGLGNPLFSDPAKFDFTLQRGSIARGRAAPAFSTPLDLTGAVRTAPSDIGCYQSDAAAAKVVGTHPFSVLRSCDIGPLTPSGMRPNALRYVTAPGNTTIVPILDATLTTTRLVLSLSLISQLGPLNQVGLTAADVGRYLVIDGLTNTVPELEGVQQIVAVHTGLNAIDIAAITSQGYDFTATPASAPTVRVLRPVRFASVAAIDPQMVFATDDLIWIDNYTPQQSEAQWAVLQYGATGQWSVYRLQPRRPLPTTINQTTIYSSSAQITGSQMILNQPVVPELNIIDPLSGLLLGACTTEIDFQTAYDPAGYNAGYGRLDNNFWGPNQVGRVWWNLATVRFIDPFTDVLGASDARDQNELQYRLANWAQIAPQTSADVYEWTESTLDPLSYTASLATLGAVYNAAAPAWVERSVYDSASGQDNTLYYFWVGGLTAVPAVSFRQNSISTVAHGLADPASSGTAWMAAVCPTGLLVSGVAATLNDTTTVMKVRLDGDASNVGTHDQWLLMRPGDATSLPPDALWTALRDSLAGFAVGSETLTTLPDPTLSLGRSVGIDDGQSMFIVSDLPAVAWQSNHVYYYGDLIAAGGFAYQCVVAGTSGIVAPSGYSSTIIDGSVLWAYHGVDRSRGGLLDARAAFVGSVNRVLAASPIGTTRTAALLDVSTRTAPFGTLDPLSNADPTKQTVYLTWAQRDASYPYEPPPGNEWDAPYEVHTLSQRNDLLASTAFQLSCLPLWTISGDYSVGDRISSAGCAYRCIVGGTAGSTPPSGVGASIGDGGVVWAWVATLVNNGGAISVLLSNYTASIPGWSIWIFDPNTARTYLSATVDPVLTLLALADLVFALKPAYDVVGGATIALMPPSFVGQRVLIENDTQNFWAIYAWLENPNGAYAAANSSILGIGFDLDYFDSEPFSPTESFAQSFDPRPVPAWTADTVYAVGVEVASVVNVYQCTGAGTSGGVVPTGTGQTIIDGSATWAWLRRYVPAWTADTVYPLLRLGQPTLVASFSNVYQCIGAGTSGSNAPTGTSETITDGSATWVWLCGYVLWRAQSYATASFIKTSDWYDTATLTANGYSVAQPPIVTYASVASRDATEGASPTNLFVAIITGGGFQWTAFIGGVWQVVAISDGTVQLSATFADASAPVYAVSTPTRPMPLLRDQIATRDGSWELRVLVQALRWSGLLLDAEINSIWFDLINFVHVQQNDIDWLFKTAFMTISGLAVPLIQTSMQTVDQTINVTDYVNEVKPYRAKIRTSTTQYLPPVDLADFTASTDFDNPPYLYDKITNSYRALDPGQPNDQAILQTAPWSDWYANYLTQPSLIRSFTLTITFDRIAPGGGNWDMMNWDGVTWDSGEADLTSAAYRILTYYQPTETMPSVAAVMAIGLLATEDTDDGGTLTPEGYAVAFNPTAGFALTPDLAINQPATSRPGGFDLRAPYYAADHPEERVPFSADDGLQLTVTARPHAGAPPQLITTVAFNAGLDSPGAILLTGTAGANVGTTVPSMTVFYDFIAQSADAVMVFRDGVRAIRGSDYTIDYFGRSATVDLLLDGVPVRTILLHAFGFGAASVITEQHYLDYGTGTFALNASSTALTDGDVLVVLDGLVSNEYSVSSILDSTTELYDNSVNLTATGSDVALLVYADGIASASTLRQQLLVYQSGGVYTVLYPDTQTVPAVAGTFVTRNGLRLTPPSTFYGAMDATRNWIYLPVMPSSATIGVSYLSSTTAVWVTYTAAIPSCTAGQTRLPFGLTVPTGQTPSASLAGQFVLYDHMLVALDTTFVSSNIVITIGDSGDYSVDVTGSRLSFNIALVPSDIVLVETFANAAAMGIETVCYADIAPYLVPIAVAPDYAHITMNGYVLARDTDYVVVTVPVVTTDVAFMAAQLELLVPVTGTIVATMFTGMAARPAMAWRTVTRTPAFNRMVALSSGVFGWDTDAIDLHIFDAVPPAPPDGYDTAPLDATLFDASPAVVTGDPTHAIWSLNDSFETIRLAADHAGALTVALAAADASVSLALFPLGLAVKLRAADPLPIPTPQCAGVVWIDSERIEYFGYARSADAVTLSALRRGTFGTAIPALHMSGAMVWNGVQIVPLAVPTGPSVGDRELQPMRMLIGGAG